MRIINRIRACLLAGAVALCLWLPSQAYADGATGLPIDFDTCVNNASTFYNLTPPGDSSYTAKIVYCVQYTIQTAVGGFITPLSSYLSSTVAVMFAIAIAVFGIRMFEGGHELKSNAAGFLLRFAIIWVFSANLGNTSNGNNWFLYCNSNGQCGIVQAVFDIEQQLITLVTQPLTGIPNYSPWIQIDNFIGVLINPGFAAAALSSGLLGVIAAALFSSTAGIGVFLSGAMALVEIILFAFDIVYTYLTAMLVLGFLLVISPFIIPLGIFFYTEKYVKKWLDMLMAAMLVPIMLFAFLAMFMGIFNTLIGNILMILGSTCNPNPPTDVVSQCTALDLSSFWTSIQAPTFQTPNDPGFELELQNVVQSVDPAATGQVVSPALSSTSPFSTLAASVMPLVVPGISFGSDATNWSIFAQLTFSFVALILFTMIVKSIALKMPQVAESIAGSISGVSVQPSPVTQPVKAAMEKISSSFGAT